MIVPVVLKATILPVALALMTPEVTVGTRPSVNESPLTNKLPLVNANVLAIVTLPD